MSAAIVCAQGVTGWLSQSTPTPTSSMPLPRKRPLARGGATPAEPSSQAQDGEDTTDVEEALTEAMARLSGSPTTSETVSASTSPTAVDTRVLAQARADVSRVESAASPSPSRSFASAVSRHEPFFVSVLREVCRSDQRCVGAQDPLGSWYWQAKADSASKGADDALDAVAHQSELRRLDIEYTEKRKGLLARHQAGWEREQMRRAQELEAHQRRDMEGAQTLAHHPHSS